MTAIASPRILPRRARILAAPALAALLIAVAAVAAGCSDDGTVGSDPVGSPPGDGVITGSAMGPGVSVADALASTLQGPLLVNGFLLIEGQRVRLCTALAESFPPQCGAASLEVRGLDAAMRDTLASEGSVSWSPQRVQLLGSVDGDVLTSGAGTHQ